MTAQLRCIASQPITQVLGQTNENQRTYGFVVYDRNWITILGCQLMAQGNLQSGLLERACGGLGISPTFDQHTKTVGRGV